jgi:TrmH family RNA methyltransferase
MIEHERITSAANPRIRSAARLREADARRETGLTLVDGRREVARAGRAGVAIVEVFVDGGDGLTMDDTAGDRGAWLDEARAADAADAATTRDPDVPRLAALAAAGARIVLVSRRAFERIAFGGRNEGLVAVARYRAPPLADFAPADARGGPPRPVLIVEGVEKPGNLGAILRTADAAGLAGVIACDARTDPGNPAVIRASLGTVFTVPLAVATAAEAVAWCRTHGRRVVAATPRGATAWHEARLAGATAILLGSEAHGLSPRWEEAARAGTIEFETVRLPMAGMADSLNVSATAAILAYEAVRQAVVRA